MKWSQKIGRWKEKGEHPAWRKYGGSGGQFWAPGTRVETDTRGQPGALASDAQNW